MKNQLKIETKVKSDDVIISSVKKLRNKYVVNVEFNKQTKEEIDYNIKEYTFLSDTIIMFHIFNNQSYSLDEFCEILDKNDYFISFNYALNLLSFKPRSKYELVSKLKEKEIKTQNIALVIDKLESLGYLNDLDFANGFTKAKMQKLKGPKYIESELKLKHIEDEVIKLSLEQYSLKAQWEIVDKIIEKNIDKLYCYPVNKQISKLTSILVSHGFSSNVINDRLRLIDFKCDVSKTLKKDLEKINKKFANKKYDKYTPYQIKQKKLASLLSKGYRSSDLKDIDI